MGSDQQQTVAQLESEIAALRQAIASLAALPEARGLLEEQLTAKQRALAALTGAPEPAGRTHHQTIGGNARVGIAIAGDVHGNISNVPQSGGLTSGAGNPISHVGEMVAGSQARGAVENKGRIEGPAVGVNNGTIIYGRTPDDAGSAQAEASPAEQTRVLIRRHQRRLHLLELQAATAGINTRPEVQIEIDDLRVTIAGLESQLREV